LWALVGDQNLKRGGKLVEEEGILVNKSSPISVATGDRSEKRTGTHEGVTSESRPGHSDGGAILHWWENLYWRRTVEGVNVKKEQLPEIRVRSLTSSSTKT
jgi:hypothetical protein